MRIAIYGTTHSGRLELANRIKDEVELIHKNNDKLPEKKVTIIHTNDLRNQYGLHCPWCGFDIEVEPWKEKLFQDIILKHVREAEAQGNDIVIIEGAMYPDTAAQWLKPDIQVLMVRSTVTPKEMLDGARQNDGIGVYTVAKADTYLLKYFAIQQTLAQKWLAACRDNSDIIISDSYFIDTSVNNASTIVLNRIKSLEA